MGNDFHNNFCRKIVVVSCVVCKVPEAVTISYLIAVETSHAATNETIKQITNDTAVFRNACLWFASLWRGVVRRVKGYNSLQVFMKEVDETPQQLLGIL